MKNISVGKRHTKHFSQELVELVYEDVAKTPMGSIWKPAPTMGNVLYDGLIERDLNSLDFEDLYTVSFRGPIIDGSYMRVWIDHILYSRNQAGWVSDGKIKREMSDGERIYRKYPAGSDHFSVTCKITLS